MLLTMTVVAAIHAECELPVHSNDRKGDGEIQVTWSAAFEDAQRGFLVNLKI